MNVLWEEGDESTTTTTSSDMTFPAHYADTIQFTAEYTASWNTTLNCTVEGKGQLVLEGYGTLGEGKYDYFATFYSDVETYAHFDEEDDTKM